MKEKIKNQKGFIQIPLLIGIIITAILASVETGVVLNKQGKLTPFIASVFEVFTKKEEINQENNAQKEIEQVNLTVQKVEEKAKEATSEAERLQKEAEMIVGDQPQSLSPAQISQEILVPSITNVSPYQILNNIVNYLTITGTNFKQAANVLIGGINFGTGDVINGKTITITISAGALPPNTYSVQVVNPDGETAILNSSLIIISPPPQIVATTTDQDRLNAEIKSAATDSLNKEYGLKINILQAKLIDAQTIPLENENDARVILSYCRGGQYPYFATTDYIKEVLSATCAELIKNGYNLTAIGIGATLGALRDQILILNAKISQLENELERKLLELDPDSLNKEYGLRINTLKARLIELGSFFDQSGIKARKISAFYYNRVEYPDFIDTDYKRQVLNESFKRADALNPIVRNDNLLTFVSEQISALNYQINQTYNELQRKLLESQ